MDFPFSAVYVINLHRSPERWESARRQLSRVGIDDPVRWNAVDGEALSEEEIGRLQSEGKLAADLSGFEPRAMRGEIGCALSHASLLEEIVRRGHATALVLEDDVTIEGDPEEWPERFAAAFADLPRRWEVWFLFRCLDVLKRARRISPRTVIPWTPLCAAAYAMTGEGARKLLAAARPAGKAIDKIYVEDVVRRRRVRAFAASPPLLLPGDHPSIINAGFPEKGFVEEGVNHPPEFWPEDFDEARVPFPWGKAVAAAGALLLAIAALIWFGGAR